MRQIKVVVIGQSGVGKSSIALRAVQNQYSESSVATVMAAMLEKQVTINNKILRIQIWDTAGQERFNSVSTMYFRGTQCALVVFSVDSISSLEKAEYWINKVKIYAGQDTKIYLLGNKCDLEQKVDMQKVNELCIQHQCEYVAVSAKTNEGIDQLFDSIAQFGIQNVKEERIKFIAKQDENVSVNKKCC